MPHVAGVEEVVALIAVGCVIVKLRVVVHPFASVMVAVYVPAQSAVALAPVPPEGAHAYVYGAVPPEAVTEATPVQLPLHSTFVCDPVVVKAGGCVMLKVRVVVHPFASVTVTVYVPAQRPVVDEPVPPEGAHA